LYNKGICLKNSRIPADHSSKETVERIVKLFIERGADVSIQYVDGFNETLSPASFVKVLSDDSRYDGLLGIIDKQSQCKKKPS